MNSSADIKHNLCKEYQIALENMEREADKERPSGSVGRGYAAILLSLLNYGYNVATRRSLPTTEATFGRKETGMACPLDKEGRYLRSEKQHPGYEVIKTLFSFENSKLLNDRAKSIIRKHQAARKDALADNAGGWLGQMKSPEELLQDIFAELPLDDVLSASIALLKSESNPNQKLSKKPVEEEKSDSSEKMGQASASSPMAQKDSPQEFPHHLSSLTFDHVMRSRMLALEKITMSLGKDAKLKVILPVEAPKTDYPCLMFDLRPFAAELGLEYVEGQKADKNLENLVKLMMSFFCGLVNFHSIRFYQGNFIWTQSQSSFGNIRPSLADTPPSFRFSLGLVPENFSVVVKNAYEDLCHILSNKEIKHELSILVAGTKKAKSASDSKKEKALFSFMSNAWADEDAQLYALFAAYDAASPVALFAQYLTYITELSHQSNPNQKKTRAILNYQLTLAHIKNDKSKAALAEAPDEFILLLTRMATIAKEKIKENQKPYPLQGFEGTVDDQLALILNEADKAIQSKDFSETACSIETLSRLLLLKYELQLTRERLKRSKKRDERANAGSLAASVMSHSPQIHPMMADSGIYGLMPQSNANSLTESRFDMTLSLGTFASRSGMSAFVSIVKAILKMFDKEVSYQFADIVYFELTSDIFLEIQNRIIGAKPLISAQASASAGFSDSGSNLAPVTVTIADPRSFPSRPNGESLKTRWAGDWKEIDNKDRPQILILDTTSCSREDLAKVVTEFNKDADRAPHFLIAFSSDNKFRQMGVDLVSMGEMRLFKKEKLSHDEQLNQKNLAIFSKLQDILSTSQENNSTAKAYRKLIADIGQRMTFKKPDNEAFYFMDNSEEDIRLMAEAITEEAGVGIFRDSDSALSMSLSQFTLEPVNPNSLSMMGSRTFDSSNGDRLALAPGADEVILKEKEEQLAKLTAENTALQEQFSLLKASLEAQVVEQERTKSALDDKNHDISQLVAELATLQSESKAMLDKNKTLTREMAQSAEDFNKQLISSKLHQKTQADVIDSLLTEQNKLTLAAQEHGQKLSRLESDLAKGREEKQVAASYKISQEKVLLTLAEENKQLKLAAQEAQALQSKLDVVSTLQQKMQHALSEQDIILKKQHAELTQQQVSLDEKTQENLSLKAEKISLQERIDELAAAKQHLELALENQDKQLQLQQVHTTQQQASLNLKTTENVDLRQEKQELVIRQQIQQRNLDSLQVQLQNQQVCLDAKIAVISALEEEMDEAKAVKAFKKRINEEKLHNIKNQMDNVQQLVQAQPIAPSKTAWWKYALAAAGCLVGGLAAATGIGAAIGLPLLAFSLSSVAGIAIAAGGGALLISSGIYTGMSTIGDAGAQKSYEDQVAAQGAALDAAIRLNDRGNEPVDDEKYPDELDAAVSAEQLDNDNPEPPLPRANDGYGRAAPLEPPSIRDFSIYRPNLSQSASQAPAEQKLGNGRRM